MTAEEIRHTNASGESPVAQMNFALSMLQEIAAQLAEMNREHPRPNAPIHIMKPREVTLTQAAAAIEELGSSVREHGSIIPFIHGKAAGYGKS